MKTIDIGRLFFSPAQFETDLPRLPMWGTLPSQETEPPFRTGSVVFARIPFTKFGGFIGWWGSPATNPDEALMQIIAGEGFDLDDEIDEDDKRTVRQIVAQHAEDWDDEWQILNMLDLSS